MRAALLAAAALAAVPAHAAFCNGKPDPNAQPNAYPINTAPPVYANRTVPNGKAYRAGQGDFSFWVAHIWGTPYELGYAHGQLFKEEVTTVVPQIWGYMESQVTSSLPFLPSWLSTLIANWGLDIALDVLADLEAPSTPSHFYEELQGIAAATGLDYKLLLRIHLIGELTQGDCSYVGAFGAATAGGKTLGLRALDWDLDIPSVNYPAVIVYHPAAGNGHAFANVGFLGWIGALSGQSSAKLGIHEIGVSYPDATFGNESFAGIPFTFLLRDILQYDNSYQDTVARVTGANRTCDLILGVTDGNAGTSRGFEVSATVANVFDPTNLQPLADWHPRIPDIVYWGMDWLCPSYNQALSDALHKYYGALDPAVTISSIVPIVQTGDTHTAVYDLTDNALYVSFCKAINDTSSTPEKAFDRQFTMLDLNALFAEAPPSL